MHINRYTNAFSEWWKRPSTVNFNYLAWFKFYFTLLFAALFITIVLNIFIQIQTNVAVSLRLHFGILFTSMALLYWFEQQVNKIARAIRSTKTIQTEEPSEETQS